MTMNVDDLTSISLTGLEIAPSQVYGAVRLVPLIRRNAPGDLRLSRRSYRDDLTIVATNDRSHYASFVPHGMVIDWTPDGSPVASYGAHMGKEGMAIKGCTMGIRVLERMAKRETGNRLRFLPLHLAMEGFLSLFFSGPEIAWQDYSRSFRKNGFQDRSEYSVSGRHINGLEDALRIFEIHEEQVGMLIFVAEEMASAFVTPHPDDYRALHETLLLDFYGELIAQYGCLYNTTANLDAAIVDSRVTDLKSLRAEVARVRADWGEFHGLMASNLIGRTTMSRPVYRSGPFTLNRFLTTLDPACENHIGEMIMRENGTLEYLKTYRLSAAQTRRAHLLSQLAENAWNLEDAATALKTTRDELVYRLEKAGFGYILNRQVLEAAQSARWTLSQQGKKGAGAK